MSKMLSREQVEQHIKGLIEGCRNDQEDITYASGYVIDDTDIPFLEAVLQQLTAAREEVLYEQRENRALRVEHGKEASKVIDLTARLAACEQERDRAFKARDNFMHGVEDMRTERSEIQRQWAKEVADLQRQLQDAQQEIERLNAQVTYLQSVST